MRGLEDVEIHPHKEHVHRVSQKIKRRKFVHSITQKVLAHESTSMAKNNLAEKAWLEQKPGEWIF
jgi:hypothetical protein